MYIQQRFVKLKIIFSPFYKFLNDFKLVSRVSSVGRITPLFQRSIFNMIHVSCHVQKMLSVILITSFFRL